MTGQQFMKKRIERFVIVVGVCGMLAWLALASRPGAAAQGSARVAWEYRQVEVDANSVQAELENLGQDGW